MEWVEFGEAGIDDVHRLDLIVPVEDVEAAVVQMLPEIKAQAARVHLSAQEESNLVPAMTLFNTPLIIQKHKVSSSASVRIHYPCSTWAEPSGLPIEEIYTI